MLRFVQFLILAAFVSPLAAQSVPMTANESEGQLLQIEQALAAGRLVQADAMLSGLGPRLAAGYHNRINLLLAELHIAREQIDPAERYLALVDGSLVDSCKYHSAQGWIAYQRHNWQQAVQMVAKAVMQCPSDAGRWNLLGQALSNLGEYAAGIEAYDAALELAPDHPAILNNRALAYAYGGSPDQALADLDRAAQVDPLNLQFQQNRAFLRANLGLPVEDQVYAQSQNAGSMLAMAGDGARTAQRHDAAAAYYAQALLKLERFDPELWRRANGMEQ